MKQILILLLFFTPFVLITAQDSTHVDPPKIVSRLKVGKMKDFNSKGIKFVSVIDDSRCPKGVTCIWEGEVKIIVGFYQDGKVTEEKELVFSSKTINPDNMKELLVTDKKTIYAYTVSPYPSSEKPIHPSEYYLELLIK